MADALGEGREGLPQSRDDQCAGGVRRVGARGDWLGTRSAAGSREVPGKPHRNGASAWRCAMHGTGIAGLDMGAASLKMNDDGSFNLLVGATDLGTGSDTVLAQIAAETLGVPLNEIIVYSSDTDFTPFDTGAYASSTTYISGGAVLKAAEDSARANPRPRGEAHAASCTTRRVCELEDRRVIAPGRPRSVTLEQVALHCLHQADQHQIMATASHMSELAAAVRRAVRRGRRSIRETGQVTVKQLVMAVDCGIAINPITASGQVEGGMMQALGYGHCEEMVYDEQGVSLATASASTHLPAPTRCPSCDVIFVETYEPSGPYGAKAVAEIPKDGVAPALASAIHDATGVYLRGFPLTPERVWRAMQGN